ncbi:MAG: signal recognition particle protein [Smithellaceae bacterium]
MFESLSEKLESIFKKLKGKGILKEEDVNAALKEIRLTLLEADVNFKVVKNFIEDVRNRSVGKDVLESITPGQQVVKIVHERLAGLLGGVSTNIKFGARLPAVIMMVGLQGSGKTTTAVKLAHLLSREKKIYLVSADIYRPAAVEQLAVLSKKINAGVFGHGVQKDPVNICLEAVAQAKREGYEVVIVDTAGRLHIDDAMMEELHRIRDNVRPAEIIYVADAMTGQDAVNVGAKFNELIGIDGVIMTKMDGDARGGAALSLKAVIGKPIKFIGSGEKIEALEVFYPERIASRILGMGDIISLVEKAQASYDEKAAIQLKKKIRKNEFTLEDFREQLIQIKKMGTLNDVLGMIPGMKKMKNLQNIQPDDKELAKTAAIIDSMTKRERQNYQIIDGRRRKRIAVGSGTSVQDVNRVLNNYSQIKKMMSKFTQKGSIKSLMRNFPF